STRRFQSRLGQRVHDNFEGFKWDCWAHFESNLLPRPQTLLSSEKLGECPENPNLLSSLSSRPLVHSASRKFPSSLLPVHRSRIQLRKWELQRENIAFHPIATNVC